MPRPRSAGTSARCRVVNRAMVRLHMQDAIAKPCEWTAFAKTQQAPRVHPHRARGAPFRPRTQVPVPCAHSTLHLRGASMSVDRCGTAWAGHSTRCAASTAAAFGAWRHSVAQRAARHRSNTRAPYPNQAIRIRSTCAWATPSQSRAAGWHSKPWDAAGGRPGPSCKSSARVCGVASSSLHG